MQYLTLEQIKAHSRIDLADEDELLEQLGEAAEQAVLGLLGRTLDDVTATFGTTSQPVPRAIVVATLMVVDNLYTHRTPASQVQLYQVPYGVDLQLKPYMRLTGDTRNAVRDKLIEQLREQRQLLAYKYGLTENAHTAVTLASLYEQIDAYVAQWQQIDRPQQAIVADMRQQAAAVQTAVDQYIASRDMLDMLG